MNKLRFMVVKQLIKVIKLVRGWLNGDEQCNYMKVWAIRTFAVV